MIRFRLCTFVRNISEGDAMFLLYSIRCHMVSTCPITDGVNLDHLIKPDFTIKLLFFLLINKYPFLCQTTDSFIYLYHYGFIDFCII